ncbi:MAG: tRNA (adenosine(37)-N6)-dimethylallyltransferase MiaA [Phycisphaerales bacterium]|nr:tRNA (adenosine(37)-N6)-dimethylallyltransferase MiaA [Phycisphaerales bacterium]
MTNPDSINRYPVIVGPTAGGKTALAVELAKRFGIDRNAPGEVVTADAYQIYRDLHIGTAKPTIDEREGIPHHLIDIIDLKDRFTVHDWLKLANPLIESLQAQGSTPVVVGGTNLYVKSFLDGLFESPEPSEAVKEQIEGMSQPDRRTMLTGVDPQAADRIDGADIRRTRRALEVYLQTGTPITDLQRQWEHEKTSRPEAVLVGLDWPTELINSRINQRVKIMIDQGLVDEARAIFDSNGFGDQSCEAIGYKQLIAHFSGNCTLDEAIERIKIDTRRFAKNQRTWLKRLRIRPGSIWVEAGDRSIQDIADEVLIRFK